MVQKSGEKLISQNLQLVIETPRALNAGSKLVEKKEREGSEVIVMHSQIYLFFKISTHLIKLFVAILGINYLS